MTDRVTLYRVRRPDGTVIGLGTRALNETGALSYACAFDENLRRLWLIEDLSIRELRDKGYAVEAVEYVPAAEVEELEGAARDLDIALAKHFRISDGERTLGWGTPDGLELLDETESGGLAAAWRELRRKLGVEEG